MLAAEFGERSTGAESLGDRRQVIDGLVRAHHSQRTECLECSSSTCTERFLAVVAGVIIIIRQCRSSVMNV